MVGKKYRLLLTISVVVVFSGSILIYFLKSTHRPLVLTISKPEIHLAGNPKISLSRARAKVVYFVPNDPKTPVLDGWLAVVEKAMEEEQKFFDFELNGASTLSYDIYPEPIIGKGDHLFYDSDITDGGNPHALIAVRQEILQSVFSKSGGLYRSDFSTLNDKDYNFLVIIYGNTGASAMIFKDSPTKGDDVVAIEDDGPPAIILSSSYLTSTSTREFGPTILAHEMAHAYGLSDGYDTTNGAVFSNDLMGEGRNRILSSTYLSEESKKQLGLEY